MGLSSKGVLFPHVHHEECSGPGVDPGGAGGHQPPSFMQPMEQPHPQSPPQQFLIMNEEGEEEKEEKEEEDKERRDEEDGENEPP